MSYHVRGPRWGLKLWCCGNPGVVCLAVRFGKRGLAEVSRTGGA